MSREFKFRVPLKTGFAYFDLEEIADGHAEYMEWSKAQQYTGLKDKNGIEIYEGDIVSLDDEWYDVVFGDGRFAVEHVGGLFGQHKKCTVVGNIHEGMGKTNND